MPKKRTDLRRVRKQEERRRRNRSVRSAVKTFIGRAVAAIEDPHAALTETDVELRQAISALDRAALRPPLKGAHLLRHSLATRLLREGASLTEIGQVLRHRAVATTEIYAKVDLAGLRALARPWPASGGAR